MHGAVVASGIVVGINTGLALLATTVLWHDPHSAWLLVALAAVFGGGYRAYESARRRYARVQLLYRFTQVLSRATSADEVVSATLQQARSVLGARSASISV